MRVSQGDWAINGVLDESSLSDNGMPRNILSDSHVEVLLSLPITHSLTGRKDIWRIDSKLTWGWPCWNASTMVDWLWETRPSFLNNKLGSVGWGGCFRYWKQGKFSFQVCESDWCTDLAQKSSFIFLGTSLPPLVLTGWLLQGGTIYLVSSVGPFPSSQSYWFRMRNPI